MVQRHLGALFAPETPWEATSLPQANKPYVRDWKVAEACVVPENASQLGRSVAISRQLTVPPSAFHNVRRGLYH